ncbi:MAG: penicillin-binding protein 3 [Gammaproteobacteria bacterium]|nr:MAG: penicillin-binding protein 3 [Gammaproteobacteria bacterium]
MNERDAVGRAPQQSFQIRWAVACGLLVLMALVLVGRAVHLQVFNKDFLISQAEARHLRTAKISANRGVITDRNGQPLAASMPVDSLWVSPQELARAPEYIPRLARALGLEPGALARQITRNVDKDFMYLQRHMNPADARAVLDNGIPGVHVLREYRRYYPAGEVTGHLVGFTNVDDDGQEGMELEFDGWLRGHPGKKLVLRDRLGRVVEDVERLEPPSPGREVAASIDLRIQYLAYRELKAAVQENRALSGSAVVLDAETGEVLAMVNQPSYNPNDRSQYAPARFRNRAITDLFEPGSSFKPLIIAAALESGQWQPGSRVDTSPGMLQVANKVIEDEHNLGVIDLATLLARSSNVGVTKVALSLPSEQLWSVLTRFGIGRPTSSGFPGESAGLLSPYENWRPIAKATMAYGYGLSVTPLQLAQSYAVFAADGVMRPVSLIRVDHPPIGRKVLSTDNARAMVELLEHVVAPDGTGLRAAVAGYRVAGKTGTARKFDIGGYSSERYTAVFAGVAPVSRPRLAVVVVVDEPRAGEYYGGAVAAPVFSKIVAGAMRILAIAPDKPVAPSRREAQPAITAANNP